MLRSSLRALGILGTVCALSLTSLGCGGGGGGSPTEPQPGARNCAFPEPPPNFPDRNATFVPANAGVANSLTLQVGPSCQDLLVLEVVATGVTDVHRVVYEINFNRAALTFDNSHVGPFLTEQDTVQVTGGAGAMGDLTRPAGSAGVSGTGLVSMVVWAYNGPTGTYAFRMTGQLFDSAGDQIGGVVVAGGTVTITN